MWGTTSQEEINAEGVVRFIAQGWRQPTLGYACSEEVNAVGVVRFLREMS
ncbi:6,7-dimethyl-8-ribityllumazine synthase subunit [Prevotella salivae]|uniref:6,7-dimethyl-8-ribityllumazine synthase subunit n=1 Tax=Segatella salivae TaxID=228604 RepID=A0AAW4NS59_9BACT|nr:6,7-dimethyl-8-ribityllumazine synthase subunit [Segatella salivae]MBW4910425.1 6,7-dimethyl-8-ribityllumazine synthase subunit [Segatella salivae]